MAVVAGYFDFPLVLNLRDQQVVVVGAGTVGRRKLGNLLRAGARIRLVDPCLTESPFCSSRIESIGRAYQKEDLRGARLVFACTDSAAVNGQIIEDARLLGVFSCCSDNLKVGDFSLPAILRRGALQITVSTGGGSPTLAALLRDRLAEQVPDSWGLSVEIMAAVRRKWLTAPLRSQYNQQVLRCFWENQLLPLLDQGKVKDIDQLLQETFGEAFSLAQLQIELPEGMPWGP